MRIFRNLIITILLLTLAAISVVGIMIEWPPVLHWTPYRINAIGHSVLTIMRPELLLFLMWLLILLATLFVFFLSVVRPRKRMKIEVQMGGGRVVIMEAAIKKYIRNALSELGEVTVRKIDLREHRNLVTTDITADVRTKENLPILERRIIGRVRAALAEDLGITNLGDVHVLIRNFEMSGRSLSDGSAVKPRITDRDVVADKSDSTREKSVPPINDSDDESPAIISDDVVTPLAAPADVPEVTTQPFASTDPSPTENRFGDITARAPKFNAVPAATESSQIPEAPDYEPLILADAEPLPQTDAPASAAPHDDLDDPLPWALSDSEKKDSEDSGDNKNDFRPL